jgi:hypothetical protein
MQIEQGIRQVASTLREFFGKSTLTDQPQQHYHLLGRRAAGTHLNLRTGPHQIWADYLILFLYGGEYAHRIMPVLTKMFAIPAGLLDTLKVSAWFQIEIFH